MLRKSDRLKAAILLPQQDYIQFAVYAKQSLLANISPLKLYLLKVPLLLLNFPSNKTQHSKRYQLSDTRGWIELTAILTDIMVKLLSYTLVMCGPYHQIFKLQFIFTTHTACLRINKMQNNTSTSNNKQTIARLYDVLIGLELVENMLRNI